MSKVLKELENPAAEGQEGTKEKTKHEQEQAIEQEQEEEEIVLEPVDSKVNVEVALGGVSARILIEPPLFDGLDITKEKILEALSEAGIVHGINQAILAITVTLKKYNEWITIASCTQPENGIDGTVEFLFNETVDGRPKEDHKGNVNFKDLGTVRVVHEGTVIAKITKETEGTPGTSVRNEPMPQQPGKPAKVFFGDNIVLSEDGLLLSASASGNLDFKNGRFSVQPVLRLDGDIDVTTGNISFIGDIIIRGDVREGFSVSSEKNITVQGAAFNANLIAGQKIVVKNGAIGSHLSAGGTIEVEFAENSSITCSELLKTKSMYFCDVYCKGQIEVNTGVGSIVGGKIISTNNIYATNIGSRNYTPTVLIVGDNAIMLQERVTLVQKIAALNQDEEKCNKIISFLRQKEQMLGELPEEKLQIITSAENTIILTKNEIEQVVSRINEIDEYMKNKQNLSISVRKELYPGCKLVINDSVYIVNNLFQHCQAGLGDDGIEIRSL